MAKILVLYYSMYGHIETLAGAIAEGARKVSGVDVTIKRVPETMPAEAFAKAGGKTNQQAPVATPHELADYDGIIFGTPTRFGNMSGQMRTFLDQTGGLWHRVHCMAKWPAYSPPPGQAEDKNTPSLQPGPLWPITVLSLFQSVMVPKSYLMSRRLVVVHLMAQRQLPEVTVPVSQALKNWR